MSKTSLLDMIFMGHAAHQTCHATPWQLMQFRETNMLADIIGPISLQRPVGSGEGADAGQKPAKTWACRQYIEI